MPAALATARAAADLVLADPGLRRPTGSQIGSCLVAGARASAQLTADPQRWAPGALRLSTELPMLAGVLRAAPAQALARAHFLAAYGLVPEAELGRLQTKPGVAGRMSDLGELLTWPASTSQPPALVLAAVAHAEIATVAPFGSADQIVARAVERMVLISSGFDPYGLIVSELGHLRQRDSYRQRLAAYSTGSVAGVCDWILAVAQAAVDGAEASPAAVGQELSSKWGSAE